MAAHVGPRLPLPHGYEGRGPGASFRAARRLYCDVRGSKHARSAHCTTPAYYFHISRRQLKARISASRVLMNAKSRCCVTSVQVSTLGELSGGESSFSKNACSRAAEYLKDQPISW